MQTVKTIGKMSEVSCLVKHVDRCVGYPILYLTMVYGMLYYGLWPESVLVHLDVFCQSANEVVNTICSINNSFLAHLSTVLDLGLISSASLGPRASTKVESHVNFTESWKV